MSGDILALIDGAIASWDSADAMRWTPEARYEGRDMTAEEVRYAGYGHRFRVLRRAYLGPGPSVLRSRHGWVFKTWIRVKIMS